MSQSIDVHQLHALIQENPSLCLIDVREPHEWAETHIPTATLIPLQSLENKIAETVPDKHTPIYVHCRTDGRARIAITTLLKLGYHHVFFIIGGILAWELALYPTQP